MTAPPLKRWAKLLYRSRQFVWRHGGASFPFFQKVPDRSPFPVPRSFSFADLDFQVKPGKHFSEFPHLCLGKGGLIGEGIGLIKSVIL